MQEVTVYELAKEIKAGNAVTVLDVREGYEFDLGHLTCNCIHIPMEEIPVKAKDLDIEKTYYVMCKSGKRAAAVANFLTTNFNFSNLNVVIGGIEAYANEIDNSIEV